MPIIEGIQNFVRDSAIQSAVDDVQNPGERNANMMSRFAGLFTGVDVDKAVDDHTQKVENLQIRKKYKPQIESLGGKYFDGMTEGQALESIQSLRDERVQVNAVKAQNLAFNDPAQKAERERQAEMFRASRTDVANQMALTREQMAQTAKDRLLDRADAREAKAAELEYAKIRDRKADQQYNERMEQLDRKDRRQGISSLAAGLAALGAAFAA